MIIQQRPLAVITGASSGIGFELSRQFAENGFDLLMTASSEALMERVAQLKPTGAEIDYVQADLTQHDGVEKLYQAIKERGRPVEAIAINAGVGVGGPFIQTALEDEQNMIALNVTSTVHLAKRIIPDMVAQKSGKILFTASVASVMPAPFEAVYGATKAFVLSFAEALRSELQDTGVSVTALMPGPTETNFFHRAGLDDTKVGASKKDDPADVARDGFKALMDGDDKIISHSIKSKMMGGMSQIIPDAAAAKMHHNMAKPGSAN